MSQISSDDPLQSLSIREVEILRMLGQGKSMTAISESLGIAYKTVANICTQMKVKLGVDRTADLIRLAIETLKTRKKGAGLSGAFVGFDGGAIRGVTFWRRQAP